MTMMSRYLILLCFLTLVPAVLVAEDPTPLQRAQAAFEAVRDEEHRKRMRLTWGDADTTMPGILDVLMLRGYLNHDLLMMQWRNGLVTASVVTVDRQWFYHPSANARSFTTLTVPSADFIKLWQAVQHLMMVQATEMVEPMSDPEDLNGNYREIKSRMTSHAAYHLLTWTFDPHNVWHELPVLRGSGSRDGIRDLDELKMAAISKLVWERFPKTSWIPDPDTQTAERWHAFLRTLLPSCRGDGVTPVSKRTRLLVEDACEMLGDMGDAADVTLLTSIADSLRPPEPRVGGASFSSTSYEDSLRTAIAQCIQRITLRATWDSGTAVQAIHANTGVTYSGNDQELWLRNQFRQHDSERYRAFLLNDLHAAESALVVMSVSELLRHHPGEHRDELQRLLKSDEPEVVLISALSLMGKTVADYGRSVRPDFAELCARSKDDPLLRDALSALEHLAGDPVIPITPETHWFDFYPRKGAMQVLSACPLPWGWDEQRHQRQLNNPEETDGRVVAHLLGRTRLPLFSSYNPQPPQLTDADRATLITTWRRCLNAPLTRGTKLAMEELIALHDVESLPRLNQLRDRMRAGASRRPVSSGDNDSAQLPWLSTYEVDELDKKLKTLRD